MSQPLIFSLIDKAVFDYELIKDGDKILIAASGGKDSTVLVEYFSNRIRRPDCNFSIEIVHIETEITKSINPCLSALFSKWNVEVKNVKVDVLGRLKMGHKMSCYWCSTQRRTELLNYAIKNGFNKIALGHHMDDMLETLLMNMLEKAELTTMPPLLEYEKYPVSIIRPLCYVQEATIVEHAQKSGYISETCTCEFLGNGFRKQTRSRLEALTEGDPVKKEHLFKSLKNIDKNYLP